MRAEGDLAPVSRVSPKPRFDRNHCLLSSTKLTRQMGTFNAVPQSAVMRSNSWWRGVSSLRAVRDGWPGRAGAGVLRAAFGWMAGGPSPRRPSSVDARAPAPGPMDASSARRRVAQHPGGGAPFHSGTLVSYSSKLRSVDMRSSSSSGIGHDMVESLRASYQNPCWAARRRVPACAASAGHRRSCDHVKTSVGVAAVPYAARFGRLTAPQVAIGLRRARQARVRVDLLSGVYSGDAPAQRGLRVRRLPKF